VASQAWFRRICPSDSFATVRQRSLGCRRDGHSAGYLDDVPVDAIQDWERGFHEFMAAQHPAIGEDVRTRKALNDDLTTRLRAAIDQYKGMRPR